MEGEFIGHDSLLVENKGSCHGEMIPVEIYREKKIVDREWYCDKCGVTYREHDFIKIIEEVY